MSGGKRILVDPFAPSPSPFAPVPTPFVLSAVEGRDTNAALATGASTSLSTNGFGWCA